MEFFMEAAMKVGIAFFLMVALGATVCFIVWFFGKMSEISQNKNNLNAILDHLGFEVESGGSLANLKRSGKKED